jgi:hypothetical protein
MRPVLPVLWFAAVLSAASAQTGGPLTGDAAAAEKYAAWARQAMDEGRWAEAEAALERGADFASLSSDLSYLLALARSQGDRPQGAVLEAVRRALGVNRWNRYSPGEGRLLEARTLIRLRAYAEALGSLSLAGESADAACLRLLSLRFLPDLPAFRRTAALTLDRYPRDPRPARILLEYLRSKQAAGDFPEESEQTLLEAALRRLPLLLEAAPPLAYLAAPLMRDDADARRLLASYRALDKPDPASVPPALNLGLIGEEQAVAELFSASPPVLDRALILAVWGLLRNNPGRDALRRNLLSFSGVIIEDRDQDGYAESRTRYREGVIMEYRYDADQDGLADLAVSFSAGIPVRAETVVLPGGSAPQAAPAASSLPPEEGDKALVEWESYPAVLRTSLGGMVYVPRPGDFLYTPLRFTEFLSSGTASFLYPQREEGQRGISRRSLVSFSQTIERPGLEFEGGRELLEMDRGIPRQSVEYLEGRPAAITDFAAGRPLSQRIDLDLDGRMETLRRFRRDIPGGGGESPGNYPRVLESSESDWDGDGVYETGEDYLPDGTLGRAWDLDRNGERRVYRRGGDN